MSLFGKIMRNDCNEGFRLIYEKAKDAITAVMKFKIQKKYKIQEAKEVSDMVIEIHKGGIEEWLWVEIIYKMYNQEHASEIEKKIRALISNDIRLSKSNGKRNFYKEDLQMRRKQSNTIPFSDFKKVII